MNNKEVQEEESTQQEEFEMEMEIAQIPLFRVQHMLYRIACELFNVDMKFMRRKYNNVDPDRLADIMLAQTRINKHYYLQLQESYEELSNLLYGQRQMELKLVVKEENHT